MRELTGRQLEVARLIANGLTTEQIANHLGLATPTVRAHVLGAMGNLGVVSRRGIADALEKRGIR